VVARQQAALTHSWNLSRSEAAAIQRRLARKVELRALPATGPGSPRFAAAVDVSYECAGSLAWATAVVMDRRFRILSTNVVQGKPDGPYAPGYLAFREGRLSLEALHGLGSVDLVFLDGHGVVHERALGLASHLGILLGVPTIGVAKTPFHPVEHGPGPARGDYCVLTKEWGAQGASLTMKPRVKPVYVSPGHLVDLDSAIALCLAWSTGKHRVPEPLSAAHTLSREARNADQMKRQPNTGRPAD
jgi:deoxyribonuclease V